MEQEIFVLGYQSYDFDKDGERQTGSKILYFTNYSLNLELKKGCLPLKSVCSLGYSKNLNSGVYPFICTAVMISVPDSKGNPVMTIESIKDIKSVDVSELFELGN